jgi:thiol-disulfide isomerase/thioredoxin
MKEKMKHYMKEIFSFFIVMTLFANLLSYYKSGDLNKNKLQIEMLKLLDNTPYKIAKEKPILIHFWATWCPTCKMEAKNIDIISQHFNVVTFVVNSGTQQEIQTYLKENDLSYKVVNDQFSIYAKEFNISAYPTTFIYDKDKKLLFSDVGYTSTLGLYLRMWWASF